MEGDIAVPDAPAAAAESDVSVLITRKVDPAEYERHSPLNDVEMKDDTVEVEVKAEPEPKPDPRPEIKPDHYFEGGRIPVFKPTMDEFGSFKDYIDRINHYGMKSGIVKVIPPKEWVDSLPPLDDKVRSIKVKNPIEQQIAGNNGVYRQINFVKQRTYNLPQWRNLCEASDHQPPAKRGERRMNQNARGHSESAKMQRARRAKKKLEMEEKEAQSAAAAATEVAENDAGAEVNKPVPATPTSPAKSLDVANTPETPAAVETPPPKGGRQPRSTRAKRAKRMEIEDEIMYEDFDYRLSPLEDFSPERCRELEKHYWKSLTYNNPLYGADMPGSLFDDSVTSWNVAKLENILDCLGKKIPGVNTAYLYMGMWKATFAWHLEDVDLYSINYIHFGAPKQWYSISQEDAAKFETVMKGIWPSDSKKCDQFLRHKTFLVSPSHLAERGITVNRLVHYQHEFVITFPYGYHSGYNLGYNCAESVNFATHEWLNYAKKSKKCHCIDDAVWVDAEEVERKLRGDPTEDEEEFSDEEQPVGHPLSPPDSVEERAPKRRKKEDNKKRRASGKVKTPKKPLEACVLCPNLLEHEEVLDTDDGQKAHRTCALFIPETYFRPDEATGREVICNIQGITKARYSLKCSFCKQQKGACFQCSVPKCVRAYHGTCAAMAGVLIQLKSTATIQEDGSELATLEPYTKCKFHRPKRAKEWKPKHAEVDQHLLQFAEKASYPDVVQMQFEEGDMFAGVVMENRVSENMLLVKILPDGDTVEMEYKWVLPPENEPGLWPYRAPKPQPPLKVKKAPAEPKPRKEIPVHTEGIPLPGMLFTANSPYRWCEFELADEPMCPDSTAGNMQTPWYYLPTESTMVTARYTHDPTIQTPNEDANFVGKYKKPRAPPQPKQLKATAAEIKVKTEKGATPKVGTFAPPPAQQQQQGPQQVAQQAAPQPQQQPPPQYQHQQQPSQNSIASILHGGERPEWNTENRWAHQSRQGHPVSGASQTAPYSQHMRVGFPSPTEERRMSIGNQAPQQPQQSHQYHQAVSQSQYYSQEHTRVETRPPPPAPQSYPPQISWQTQSYSQPPPSTSASRTAYPPQTSYPSQSSYPPQSSYNRPSPPSSNYAPPHQPQEHPTNSYYPQTSYPPQTSYTPRTSTSASSNSTPAPPQSSSTASSSLPPLQPPPTTSAPLLPGQTPTFSLPAALRNVLPPPRPLSESQISALSTQHPQFQQQLHEQHRHYHQQQDQRLREQQERDRERYEHHQREQDQQRDVRREEYTLPPMMNFPNNVAANNSNTDRSHHYSQHPQQQQPAPFSNYPVQKPHSQGFVPPPKTGGLGVHGAHGGATLPVPAGLQVPVGGETKEGQ